MCHPQIALFADDIVMYVTNVDAVLVQAHINSDLALLYQWATINEFRINISKCQSMPEDIDGVRCPLFNF